MEFVLDHCNEGKFLNTADVSVGQIQEKPRETFLDVHNHWAEDRIYHMSTLGIFSGYADGSFRPDSVMTRAEFVTVIVRAFGLSGCTAKGELLDVAPRAWYADAVYNLYAKGIIKGRPDGSFGGNRPITMEEVSVILWRVFQQLGVQIAMRRPYRTFKDEEHVSAYAKEAVKGIYQGNLLRLKKHDYLKPKAPMTRAQVVTVMSGIFTI